MKTGNSKKVFKVLSLSEWEMKEVEGIEKRMRHRTIHSLFMIHGLIHLNLNKRNTYRIHINYISDLR